ncbi:HlyD family secretion protein [Pedobacter sp. CG_S7]|uniref:HlyD family secretion protein n=1 Tax=Pedobacter sp. CG_S7 TaxID=3143930 RepID=UPI003392DEE5
MKYFLYIVLLFLFSCGNDKGNEKEKQAAIKDSLSRPENVKIVAAIARVEPAGGLVQLSAPQSGIVVTLYKKAGDSLIKGDLILKIDDQANALAVDIASKQIIAQKLRAAADNADVLQYRAALLEKEEDLNITLKLALTGADTKYNVTLKRKENDVILANLQSAINRSAASESEVVTLQKQLAQSKLALSEQFIRAKQNGVLVNLDAKVGAAINALTPFATLAPNTDLILNGEIDEMFADRVKLGQNVVVNYVGNKEQIAQGKVIYLSPILENKSLFYEKAGEITDRRVRQFKVSLNGNKKLLINSKVECTIQIQ